MESFAAKRRKMDISSETSSNISHEIHSSIEMSSNYIDHYNKPTYIDKTLLIKRLFEISEYALITAPKWFGKTLNMDMVRRFIEIKLDSNGKPIVLQRDEDTGYLLDNQETSQNFKLFKGKKIFEDKEFVSKHFGQHVTIFVDFTSATGSDFEEILVNIGTAINKAFREHAYLIDSPIWRNHGIRIGTFMQYFDSEECKLLDECQILKGLNFLSRCLYTYFEKKVYVFIDQFDAPVSHMVYKYKKMTNYDRKNTVNFLKSLILNLVKSNYAVGRSLFNACHHVGGLFVDGANTITYFSFMDNVAVCEYYGFEEAEVKFLLDKFGLPEHQFTSIRKWYNSYKKTLNDGRTISIYSPYAILMYLHEKKFRSYWPVNFPDMVHEAMTHYPIRLKIANIAMSRRPFEIKYQQKLHIVYVTTVSGILEDVSGDDQGVNLFIQFLYESGCFKLLISDSKKKVLRLEISNENIYSAFDDCLYEAKLIKKLYYHHPERIDDFTTSMKELARLRTTSAVINLTKSIEKLFRSGRAPCHEFDVHSALYVYLKECNKYTTAECNTSARTRCDILTVINEVVFIIEFKFSSTGNSHQAYNQTFTSKYISLLAVEKLREFFKDDKLNVKNKIYLGIHMMDSFQDVTITISFDDEVLEESNINVNSKSQ